MPAIIEDKGKAVPSFYGISGGIKSGVQPSNWPMYAAVVITGVVIIFVLRRGNSKTGSGPVLTVVPDYGADVSNVNNMTQAILAIAAQGQGGGATTPVTPSPTHSFQSGS